MAFGLSTLNRPAKAKPYITTKVPLPSERIRRVPIQVRAEAPAETPRLKGRAPEPHEYPAYDAPENAAYAASPFIEPAKLWEVLKVAPYAHIQFESEKQLNRFRVNLWKVNSERKFRYSTRREGWTGLIIIRLK